MIEQIKKLIAGGENQHVEFKKAKNDFPNDAFASICAFLNTDGGTLILGVENDGTISGINPDSTDKIKTKFVTAINNPELINPVIYLNINELELDGKIIMYVIVPNASNVYRYKSRIYKRNHEADIDITNIHEEVSQLYLRTDNSYTENQIFPFLQVEDLRTDLIARVKKIAKINNANNDWDQLDTKEFLKRNKLYRRNYTNNQEGITLAGVLLFGTDEQIASVVPSFKFELAKCVNNPERYDDRITLQTNLLDCLEKASDFIEKYLPSPFYLEGTQRIDLRNNIFREIIANMLVHKEYSGAEPTKLIIKRHEIIAENSNKPHIRGLITLKNTTNFSKNPNIIRIFRAMGYAEDFGTGIPKLFKYCKAYTGFDPIIEDGNVFRFTLQHNLFTPKENLLNNSDQASEQVTDQVISENTDNNTVTGHKKVKENSVQVNKKSEQVSDQVTDQVKSENTDNNTVTGHKKVEKNSEQVNKSNQATNQVSYQAEIEKLILKYCKTERSLSEIAQKAGFSSRVYFKTKYINPIIKRGLLRMTMANKPNHPNQKYITIKKKKAKND